MQLWRDKGKNLASGIPMEDWTKYHPTGYLSEYSHAGNSPAGHLAGTILLLIKQKIRHYGQNESYLTYKVFQNIKLVSLYSKSVSHENSICVDFASVQVKHKVQKRHKDTPSNTFKAPSLL